MTKTRILEREPIMGAYGNQPVNADRTRIYGPLSKVNFGLAAATPCAAIGFYPTLTMTRQ
jgi:hypothetical protein